MTAGMMLGDPSETEAAGAALARAWLAAGAPSVLVTLEGELGAGKTTLMRGVLRALGETGPVRSPTYTLLESYRLRADVAVHHLDFYRIEGWEAAEEIGFRELGADRTLVAVEWASHVAALAQGADLDLTLVAAGTGRQLTLAARSPAGRALLAAPALAAIANQSVR